MTDIIFDNEQFSLFKMGDAERDFAPRGNL